MSEIAVLHKQEYKVDSQVVASAPGKLRLLGVVSEENMGYILQGALDKTAVISISKRKDHVLNCFSFEIDDRRHSSVKSLKNKREDRWLNLIKGVISEYELLGYEVSGMDMILSSTIPQRVGLGSSAAICVAAAVAIRELFQFDLSDIQMIQCAYLSESRFIVNPQSSFADAISAYFSEAGKILFFDIKKMDYQFYNIEDDKALIYLINSNVPVQIDSDELERRAEFIAAIRSMMQNKNVSALRDFDDFDLKQAMVDIPENARRFCSHVVNENSRVLEAVNALGAGKIALLGKIITRSQESLRDNYEISCPEIDWLIKRALEYEGVYGSCMTGPGFGGCLVAVVAPGVMEDYQQRLDEYERIFGFTADYYPVKFSQGAHLLFSSVKK